MQPVLCGSDYIYVTLSRKNSHFDKFNRLDKKNNLSLDCRDQKIVRENPIILIWTTWFGAVILNPLLCPGCILTYDRREIKRANAIVFHCVETRDDPKHLPLAKRTNTQRSVSCWLDLGLH